MWGKGGCLFVNRMAVCVCRYFATYGVMEGGRIGQGQKQFAFGPRGFGKIFLLKSSTDVPGFPFSEAMVCWAYDILYWSLLAEDQGNKSMMI